MTKALDFIRVSPTTGQAPKGVVVTLHGWGANAQDVASLLPYLSLPDYEFLFPNAPFPYPHAVNGRAWYDLRQENMYQGLEESRQILLDWMLSLESNTGVPLSQTILSGFSQGGAMTLDIGLRLPLAGLVVMSGYLHPGAGTGDKQEKWPPTLIMHGRQDQVVPLQAALQSRETVQLLGVAVDYHEYDTGHEINLQMLEMLQNFARKTVG
ncbi:MAG TPA: alpha/beta hydrolase [Nostocaceae cyanobacterium]|nr:alpha/beta hydrolase [Nostocaceae cyanobacterium]